MALATRSSVLPSSLSSLTCDSKSSSPRRVCVRASKDKRGDGIKSVIDGTKKNITKEDVLHHQQTDKSEQLDQVFAAMPKSQAQSIDQDYPRPEVERRPETGERSFGNFMAFDGVGPETINGRLAMVGLVWALIAEIATGQTVGEQLYGAGNKGLFFFLAVTQVIWYASLVPMFKGESPDSRVNGPWNAQAERWNGRLAMLGFLSLVITEAFTKSPVFHM